MTQSLDQRYRYFPLQVTAAHTYTVYFRKRANQGTGSYATWAEMPSLVFAFANGINDALPVDVMKETILLHLLNNNIQQWWQPRTGTVESALRDVLDTSFFPVRTGTAMSMDILVDGQFGSVFCG